MSRPLRIGGFGGGAVREGGVDQRRPNELTDADGYDLGSRGNLAAASDATAYVTLNDDGNTPAPLARLFGMFPIVRDGVAQVVAVGTGIYAASTPATMFTRFDRTGQASPVNISVDQTFRASSQTYTPGAILTPVTPGVVITSALLAGTFEVRDSASSTFTTAVVLVCAGAREGFAPRTAPGLYALLLGTSIIQPAIEPIGRFASLGTGPFAVDVASGTNGVQLYPRGIVAYNNHVFAWGFDAEDAATGEGPARVMFCNLGDPLTWGNDNVASTGVDRAFTDSDAIVLGGAGEAIRAGCVWNGRLFFGTNRGLHFIAGYGRDSFTTNGATPVMLASNVIGPHALIEGPDRALYGVGDEGLWRFTGSGSPQPLHDKLRDAFGRSTGYFDAIWVDPSSPLGAYPGTTNQDLVWLASDTESMQLLVGIPWCDGVSGGPGEDTLLIKYHVLTGGFTRQVFTGVQYTAAGYFRREGSAPVTRFLGTATAGEATIQRYGYVADMDTPAVLPTTLPSVTFGPYAPFGPEGHGVVTRAYVTLSWDTGALPLVFETTVTVDGVAVATYDLTIGPSAPSTPVDGDLWVDTAQTSTDLGNGTASDGVVAAGGYLAYVRALGTWMPVPGLGAVGDRVTVPMPLPRRQGTRWGMTMTAVSAAGRWSIEGLGMDPGAGSASA